MLSNSVNSPLFKLEYSLHIFVKHQSKLEFGMGNLVQFPIDVKQVKVNLPYVKAKEPEWLQSQSLEQWAPAIVYPRVDLHLEKN